MLISPSLSWVGRRTSGSRKVPRHRRSYVEREISWHSGSTGVVAPGAGEHVEMEADGVL